MLTSISLQPIHRDSTETRQATDLYLEAFPTCERREVKDWLTCCSNSSFIILGIFSKEKFVGFISCWDFTEFIYVEHFAIDAKIRGGGIGATTLSLLKKKYSKIPLILEVEPPYSEIAKRRIDFYQRKGFFLYDTPYLQPPYRKGDNWFELKLMTTSPIFLESNFEIVKNTIYEKVYNIN